MASIEAPEGYGTAVVEGSAAIVQRIAPFAAAIGAQLATMRLPQNMAANAAANFPSWANVTARATADNSLPADTTPSKLRLPTTLERTESGIAIQAVRDDVVYAPIFFNFGHDTGDTGVVYQLAGLAGESLNVQVRYPDDGSAPLRRREGRDRPIGRERGHHGQHGSGRGCREGRARKRCKARSRICRTSTSNLLAKGKAGKAASLR